MDSKGETGLGKPSMLKNIRTESLVGPAPTGASNLAVDPRTGVKQDRFPDFDELVNHRAFLRHGDEIQRKLAHSLINDMLEAAVNGDTEAQEKLNRISANNIVGDVMTRIARVLGIDSKAQFSSKGEIIDSDFEAFKQAAMDRGFDLNDMGQRAQAAEWWSRLPEASKQPVSHGLWNDLRRRFGEQLNMIKGMKVMPWAETKDKETNPQVPFPRP
jgi:hypothetical protein